MRRWKMLMVAAGLLPIVMLTTMPSRAMGQDDFEPAALMKRTLPDHICKTVQRGSPIQQEACRSTIAGCTGHCLRGVVLQDYRECHPNPGTSCTYTWGTVWVWVQWEADCARDPSGTGCDCGRRRPVPFPYLFIEIDIRQC